MNTITKEMLEWPVGNIKLSAYRSVSADQDSKLAGESKKVEVEVDFAGATLRSVFDRAFGAAVISWANGQGRRNVDKLPAKVTVQFTSPAKRVETPEERKAKLVAMGLPEDLAELAVTNPAKFAEIMTKVKSE